MERMNLFSKGNITEEILYKSAANNYELHLNEDNVLTFKVGDNKYQADLSSEESRNSCMHKLNQDTGRIFAWFKEHTGKCNWVLFDTSMYVVSDFNICLYIHYIEDCGLVPIIPINASSCYRMFSGYKILSELEFDCFSTENIINMDYMFAGSIYFEYLDLSYFNTVKLRTINYMFCGCTYLRDVNLSSFNTCEIDMMKGVFYECVNIEKLNLINFRMLHVKSTARMFAACHNLKLIIFNFLDLPELIDLTNMFYLCRNLKEIIVDWRGTPRLIYSGKGVFFGCSSLPNYSIAHTGVEMAKPVEDGGYFTKPY